MAQALNGASDFVPKSRSIRALATAAESCRGCELHQRATQVVFGAGPRQARMFVVGEQPGDVEDRQGEPFVGPAGHLLDRAFEQAGIAREQLYLTNAVKHFRWRPARGSKRRLHETPARRHIAACRPWLIAELKAVGPDVVLILGAVAAHALLGDGFRLTEHRGQWLDVPATLHDVVPADTALLATVHPSAVLRAPDRDTQLDAFVADLKTAGSKLVSR